MIVLKIHNVCKKCDWLMCTRYFHKILYWFRCSGSFSRSNFRIPNPEYRMFQKLFESRIPIIEYLKNFSNPEYRMIENFFESRIPNVECWKIISNPESRISNAWKFFRIPNPEYRMFEKFFESRIPNIECLKNFSNPESRISNVWNFFRIPNIECKYYSNPNPEFECYFSLNIR